MSHGVLYRVWAYEDVLWGESECDAPRCSTPGEVLCDGELRCCFHADLELERVLASEMCPGLELPPLYEN